MPVNKGLMYNLYHFYGCPFFFANFYYLACVGVKVNVIIIKSSSIDESLLPYRMHTSWH